MFGVFSLLSMEMLQISSSRVSSFSLAFSPFGTEISQTFSAALRAAIAFSLLGTEISPKFSAALRAVLFPFLVRRFSGFLARGERKLR